MSRVDFGDVRLNTAVDGPEGAPWIILSNSLGASLQMWEPQIDLLTRRFRVLRYDTRGHGASSTPPGPYDFDMLTGDVLRLMDALDIETADFMGLSKGGMTGLGLAIDHGNRFERIICADARADAPAPFRAMWDERIAKVRADGMAGIVEGTLASWMTADWHGSNPTASAAIRDMVLANDPEGYIANCQALKGLDYLRRLGDATVPILFIGGDQDMGAPPAVMQAMADATPDGRYVQIPGAAHVANINAPEAFNAAVGSFYDRLEIEDATKT